MNIADSRRPNRLTAVIVLVIMLACIAGVGWGGFLG